MKTLISAAMTAALLLGGCAMMPGGEKPARSAGQAVDDATILTKIKAGLAADPDLSALKINVDSMKGAVRLSGEVKSMALRRKAEDIARKTDGVQSVDNRLVITG